MAKDDQLCAGVFEVGLRRRLITHESIIAWADHEIASRDTPESWLIDLAMSHRASDYDLIELLRRIAGDVDHEWVFRTLLTLLQIPAPLPFEYAERLASSLYWLALDCFNADWQHRLMCEAGWLNDEISLVKGGYVKRDEASMSQMVLDFVVTNRLHEIPENLRIAAFTI